jgi:hypothetical protein
MSTQPTLRINLEKIYEVVTKAVTRTSVFLGVGLNAAADPAFRKYELEGITHFQFLPPSLPAETVDHFKEEFYRWVVANGLRDLSEAFSVYLDQLFEACAIAATRGTVDQLNTVVDQVDRFSSQGVPNKLNMLKQKFGVVAANQPNLKSLNKARSVFAHRQGIVAPTDCAEDGMFRITWVGVDGVLETPTGEVHDAFRVPEGGIPLPDGGQLTVRTVERERTFRAGEVLDLTATDLAEVCWNVHGAAWELRVAVSSTSEELESPSMTSVVPSL